MSYAQLLFAGNMSDAADRRASTRTMQERVNAITSRLAVLHARDQPDRRRGAGAPAEGARSWRTTGPGCATSARSGRTSSPTSWRRCCTRSRSPARAAWSRLFDETMAGSALRRRRQGADQRGDARPAVRPGRREAQGGAARDLARVLRANVRLFALITNTLAKDKEIEDRWRQLRAADLVAQPRQPGRGRGGRRPDRRGARRLSAPVAPLLRAEGASGWAATSSTTGTATRRCPRTTTARSRGTRRSATVLDAYGAFSPEHGRDRASASSTRRWIDAPARPGKASGAFAHPTVPSAHPYVLLNYQGKTRDVMTLAHELGHGVHQVLAGRPGRICWPTRR